jgi:hypothetical protein
MGAEANQGQEQAVASKKSPERTWAMLCHLLGLCGLTGIPLGNVLGPLVMWLIKKDESALVDREGKKALNFQISMAIYGLVVAVLCFVLIGFLLLPVLLVLWLVFTIMAAVKTSNGEDYTYPLTIGFFK